jgi:serine/threonine protein kinase
MDRWRQIETLFDEAVRQPASDRDAYLRRICGQDLELYREVTSLLSQDDVKSEGSWAARAAAELLLETSRSIQNSSSSLTPGKTLGPYTIIDIIGAGAMGEVYRARDTNLNRDVALKVLHDSFARDTDRLARLRREAQVLASLNHQNIAGIYGFEDRDGVQALVLELIDGPTLAQRIAQGPIPLDDALPIAKQIADALEAAHEHGIIHRDLKPANIKVRPDGTVKVLDFGLAKALDPILSTSAFSPSSPMTSRELTQKGMILGTGAYMSPEQARGQMVDKRADIWAFGCVVYEMLTGRRAFGGDDVPDTLARVLLKEPAWDALPTTTPAVIRKLLRRSLAKDRRQRVSDAATVRLDVEEALTLPGTDFVVSEGAARTSRRVPLLAAGAVALTAMSGLAVWLAMRTGPPRVVRSAITTSGATALSVQGNDRDVTITPDGSRVIYRGSNQLLVRALDRLEPTTLGGLGTPRQLFVSPDGQWIGFFDGNVQLKRVAITGGAPATVGQVDGSGPRGATWGPDETIVYATNAPSTGLLRIPAAGGESVVLTKPNRERGEADHLWPEFLPDGRAVLFTITATSGGLDNAQVAVLDLATRTYKVVVRGGHHAFYIPTGHLIYGAGGTLRAVAFDLARRETVGTSVTVLDKVMTTSTGGVNVAVASNGTMVYVPGGVTPAPQWSPVWVDRMGREEPVGTPPHAYIYPRLSPDGTRLALYSGDEQFDIWIWDFMRHTLRQLTLDPAQDYYPVWTPDGRRLIFGSGRASSVINLWWQLADGTGSPERLSQGNTLQQPTSVSPDGTRLVFQELGAMGRDLMVLSLGAEPRQSNGASPAMRLVTPLLQTPFDERNGIVSPDGRWLAYESDESGRFEIYVRPFPNVSDGQWPVSTTGGTRPLWAPTGKELFYIGADSALMAVRVDPRASWRAGPPARVLEGRYFTGEDRGFLGRTYDVSADGRFLMLKEVAVGAYAPAQHLVVVLNWTEELKRLVPTR